MIDPETQRQNIGRCCGDGAMRMCAKQKRMSPMADEIFPAWITKYALTDGIYEIVAVKGDYLPDLVNDERVKGSHYHGEGREWHRTREAAVIRAEKMRLAKIASLRKSIAKLEKMSFE